MSLLLASVGFGLITSAVLAIAAVGFTLQFAVTDVLNLAFAAVMTAGAFTAYLVNEQGYSVWIALVAAMAASSLLSVGAELLRLLAVPAPRRGTDHPGHRLARDGADHRVRHRRARRAAWACPTR